MRTVSPMLGPSTGLRAATNSTRNVETGSDADGEDSDVDNVLISEPIDNVTNNGEQSKDQRQQVLKCLKKKVQFEDLSD